MVKCFVNHGWENALRDFYLRYKALHREITEPYPEIRQLIAWLKENGALVALITGKGEECCGVSLQALRMEKTFDEALCGEEWFGSKGKKHGMAFKKYGISNQAICYIGDAPQDVDACMAVGVKCLSAAWRVGAEIEA